MQLYPQAMPHTPWIRLCDLWLEQADFALQARIRLRIMQGAS